MNIKTGTHHLFPKTCLLFSPSFDLFNTLHNKWSFHCKLQELGFDVLKAHLIRSHDDLKEINYTTPFALKACYSRASQSVKKVYPNESVANLLIQPHNPYITQEWAEGKRFCTYTMCHEGKIFAHATYPVQHAIGGNSCLSFESIEHPKIVKWTEKFTEAVKYTGQIAFDFIETADGKLYAIECNPRATSGLLLFNNNDRLDHALFKKNATPIYSQPGSRKQIAMGMMLYGWRKTAIVNNTFLKFLKVFFSTKDVIFEKKDIKPFLFELLAFANICINSIKHRLSIPASFTYDHEWNGEEIH